MVLQMDSNSVMSKQNFYLEEKNNQIYFAEKEKLRTGLNKNFPTKMSDAKDTGDIEFTAAVVASAYAITLVEEEDSFEKNKAHEQIKHPIIKTKSKREDSRNRPSGYIGITRWLSGNERKDERQLGDTATNKPVTLSQEGYGAGDTIPENTNGTKIAAKKTPTFSDKGLNDTGSSSRPELGQNLGQQATSTIKPAAPVEAKDDESRRSTKHKEVEAKARVDAWEKAKMEKIKKRYEEVMATTLEWEKEKKSKAERRLKQKERERGRAQALQEYNRNISRIGKIAGEAKALAEEKKRNDESRTLDKANKMRSTGKVPRPCLCF